MEVRQSQVYWIDFGGPSGLAPGARHPCVVVQSVIFNRSRIATTVVCSFTSNRKQGEAPGNVLLRFDEAVRGEPGADCDCG